MVFIDVVSEYKPGDLPPESYLEWMEWARVQQKAGIKQVECGKCGSWKTPQELSDQTTEETLQSRRGEVKIKKSVCTKCEYMKKIIR